MEEEFKLKLNDGKIELSNEVRVNAGLKDGDNVVLKIDDDGMITLQKREPWVVAEDGYILYTDGTDNTKEMLLKKNSSSDNIDIERDNLWTGKNIISKRELDKAI
jgi:bifunctional DNA-binding transcriptional regulator/antitoxin component of YhaV-PrlF toxin-antitoxin module